MKTKYILEKYDGVMWTGFIWLRLEISGGLQFLSIAGKLLSK
jgi:hypothetical protein